MTCMTYNPASAAKNLKSQGSSTTPHGSGGKPAAPKDSVRGSGMGHSPGKAGSVLNRQAPANNGPMKSY